MRYLIANWKMNLPKGDLDEYLEKLGEGESWHSTRIGIAPPFPFVPGLAADLEGSRVLVGGQNCSDADSGAYTGEVSARMLRAVGASFVIIGHSERRSLYGEGDELVAAKVKVALAANLRPLLCVGEDLQTREKGGAVALLERQLDSALGSLALPEELWIAYEPVWAIGTGRNATPAMAAEAHAAIRRKTIELSGDRTRPVILYGGSVKKENAAALAAQSEIEGFLVGGASLDADGFLAIGEALELARPGA
ncbi:MAG TPA: triose-phosphate isomerase [Thermoanaerobaculia bacterium]|nr:triose-phosphate isomerase [Thermoanaerobaculia bacterium]